MELAIKYSSDEINREIPYAVIVESWDKRLFGKGKREYEKTFTLKERRPIAGYYVRFYNWHLVKGVPDSCTFTLRNVELLQRAGDFFAEI